MAEAERVQRIFAEASEMPVEERGAFLDAECGGDGALRAEVESLLRSHDEAGRFLASPTSDVPPARSASVPLASGVVVREGPGTRIGPYKLLQLIGEGGFGSVFLAEQEEPVRRRVALKIIKLGMDTRSVIARFEAERQALALMDHPNIAKVLDAGATETGRPYFVMELVRGDPITEYCDRNTVDIEGRLALFQQTCQAVQHAHQKGIIHRDIKPSNVLVTLHDGKPVPKVIDFGIAKAMSQRLTEKTVFTELRQFIGTPEYMSPEQAEMSGIDIDTRSDVYSLGVLLYELLTGTTPFDSKRLRSAAYGEIQRIIREDTPAKPSTRISTLDTLPAVAAQRLCEPTRLRVMVRGDLDWIVMKAMEKDRTRRYESASAFAADVQRFLDHEPTAASPPSAAYRMRKFVRRHRGGVMAGAAIAMALVVGVIGTTWGMVRALDEKARADAAAAAERVAKEESSARADDLEKVVAFQSAQLAGVDLRQMGIGLRGDLLAGIRAGGDRSGELAEVIAERVGAVDGALAHVDLTGVARSALENSILRPAIGAIHEQFAGQPVVRAELLLNVSEAARYAGSLDFAEAPGLEALEIRIKELGPSDAKTMEARRCRAMLMKDRGQLEEAEAEMRACLVEARGVYGDDARVTVDIKANLATVLTAQSEYAEAADLYLSSLPWYREHLGPLDRQTLGCMASAASALSNLERFDEAEALFLESVGGFRGAYGVNDHRTIQAMNNFAGFYRKREDYARAMEVYEEALDAGRSALGEDHWLTLMVVDNIGGVKYAQKDAEGAARFARAALEGRHRTLGESHPATLRSCFNLASVEESLGRSEEAAALFRRALEGFRGVYGEFHSHTIAARSSLAGVLFQMGRFEESAAVLEEEFAALDGHPQAPKDRRGAVAEAIARVYEGWEGAEPEKGHGAKAAEWRMRAGEDGEGEAGADGPG